MKKSKKKPAKAKKESKRKTSPVKANLKKNKRKKKPARKPAKKAAPAKVTRKITKAPPSRKIMEMLLKEMEQEAKTTRKMLERIPEDKYDWKPHAKSMTMQRLATHIAELPSWATMAINKDEVNFDVNSYVPKLVNNNSELIKLMEKSLAEAKASLEKATDEILPRSWVMRSGDRIYSKSTKGEVIRMSYSQVVHHRAQLGVYLRLLDVPLPGSYGPSADENNF